MCHYKNSQHTSMDNDGKNLQYIHEFSVVFENIRIAILTNRISEIR